MMITMAGYQRIVVCAFLVPGGWVARYVVDYMGEVAAYLHGETLPEKLARRMFPDISGKYNPSKG